MSIGWTEASVIVSSIMAIATFWTIYESRRQFKEMKRQWDEDHRPRLIISVISTDDYFMFKVENIGRDLAKNVKFKFNAFLKERLVSKSSCEYFRSIEDKVYHLSPGANKYFMILPTFGFAEIRYAESSEALSESNLRDWVSANAEESISMSCSYYGEANSSYSEVINTQIKNLYNKSVRVIDDEVAALMAINSTLKSALKYYKCREQNKKVGLR